MVDDNETIQTDDNSELENQDWPNLNKYKKDNYELSCNQNTGKRIVFMGDSITEGWSNLYPKFFQNKEHINRGISGQTSPQMLIRFRADVIDLKPKTVVILAGINDIAENTGPSNVKMITDNIFSMADLAKTSGIKIVLSSILPAFEFPWKKIPDAPAFINDVNSVIKKYCEVKSFRYVDYYTSMADERKGLRESLSEDGVHPNFEGYEIMSTIVNDILY